MLNSKRAHMEVVLAQFSRTSNIVFFLSHPSLLVIAELIGAIPGAISHLTQLSAKDLMDIATLGEDGMKTLCSGSGFAPGLDRLCRRISGDFTDRKSTRLLQSPM